jgi:hypothetical protein
LRDKIELKRNLGTDTYGCKSESGNRANWVLQNVISDINYNGKKGKAVPLHAMEALGGRGDIAPTHS